MLVIKKIEMDSITNQVFITLKLFIFFNKSVFSNVLTSVMIALVLLLAHCPRKNLIYCPRSFQKFLIVSPLGFKFAEKLLLLLQIDA